MLSSKRYGWFCVLGFEALYALCLAYGLLLAGKAAALHHSLFELLPGFTWINAGSIIAGAAGVFVFAWIFAWYFVWMHNASIVKSEK